MSTIEGRAKHRNLVADPRATVVVLDSNDSLRYVELRGATTLTHEGGSELIDALSSKYTGADRWDGDDGTANVRVVIRLEPTRVRVYA
jgi:hypothetical protein